MLDFIKLQSAVDSLANSTDLDVELNNDKFEFRGRNSSYLSHQHLDWVRIGHKLGDNIVVFTNGNFKLLVERETENDEDSLEYDENRFYYLGVRTIFIKPIIDSIWRIEKFLPEWLNDIETKVSLYLPSYFNGYDEEAKPMFDKKIKHIISINGKNIDMNTRL